MNIPNAFPFQDRDPDGTLNEPHRGMTLLDYFATSALQGMLANGGIRGHMDGSTDAKDHAVWAYEYANEMLKMKEEYDKK